MDSDLGDYHQSTCIKDPVKHVEIRLLPFDAMANYEVNDQLSVSLM